MERKIEAHLMDSIDEKMNTAKVEDVTFQKREKQRDFSAEIRALRVKSEKVMDLYINNLISLEECKKRASEYEETIKGLEGAQKRQKKTDFSKLEKALFDGWKSMYIDLSKEEKRDFWRIIIREIRIYKDGHIEYNLNL